jgi:hypothetical protein
MFSSKMKPFTPPPANENGGAEVAMKIQGNQGYPPLLSSEILQGYPRWNPQLQETQGSFG